MPAWAPVLVLSAWFDLSKIAMGCNPHVDDLLCLRVGFLLPFAVNGVSLASRPNCLAQPGRPLTAFALHASHASGKQLLSGDASPARGNLLLWQGLTDLS